MSSDSALPAASVLNRLWTHPGHLVWAAIAYLVGLGRMAVPLTGDQKVYLSIAQEMREQGHWLQPLLFGQASYYKPPLQYWATLIGWQIFGFNLWGAWLPSILTALGTAWLLGEIAILLGMKREFTSAGLVFLATLSALTYGSTAQMEIYLCFFQAAAWWAALRYLNLPSNQRRFGWLYAALALAGLTALVKSPLYSIFWGAGFAVYLVISGEWELFRSRHLYQALGLGIALGASWYVAILLVDGRQFWDFYFVHENLEKASGNGSTVAGFWVAILYFFFPFTLLLVPSIRALWRGRRRGSPLMRVLLCWCVPPALFFTAYPYRTRPYLFILIPALALCVDWGWFREARSRLFGRILVITGLLWALVMMGLAYFLHQAELVPGACAIGLALAGFAGLIFACRGEFRAATLCVLGGVLAFRLSSAAVGEADLNGLRVSMSRYPAAEIGMLDEGRNIWHEVGLLSAAIGRPIHRLSTVREVREMLERHGLVALSEEQVVTVTAGWPGPIPAAGSPSLERLPWLRWKTRGQFPYRDLLLHGRQAVPDLDARIHRKFEILHLND